MDALVDLPFDIVELVSTPSVAPADLTQLREMPFRRDAYLPEELRELRRRFEADEPLAAIAMVLGRPLHGLRSKICELGWRRRSSQPWTALDDAYLARHYGSAPTAVVAAALGRTAAAVYAHAQVLGLSEGNPPRFSEWEDAQIRHGYAPEVAAPVAQIAALIGRPASGVVGRAQALGLRHPRKAPDWTDDEAARALVLAETGMRYRQIAVTMAGEGFPTRSATGVERILHDLGYSRGWGRPWPAEENDALRAAYRDSHSLRRLALRLCRSPSSLSWKAKELGLTGTHAQKNGFRQGPDWTKDEIRYLERNYPHMRTKLIAAALGRPLRAVYSKAHTLGLEANYFRDFTEDERRAIAIARDSGLSITDLADALGRDVAVVSKQAIRLGLSFKDRPHKAPRTARASRRSWSLSEILALPA